MTFSADFPYDKSFFFPRKSSPSPILLTGTDCVIRPDVPLAGFTTYRVGGPAQWYVEPRTDEELEAIFEWYSKQEMPLTLLGAGSNLLISDRGVKGLVLNTRYLKGIIIDHDHAQVTARAGTPIVKLAWECAKQGWKGLEWAVGIPGTVGGAVAMNAGAHQSCTAEHLLRTHVLSLNGSIEQIQPEQLNFSYRHSNLQQQQRLLLSATFQLQPGFSKKEVMDQTSFNLQTRKSTQPYDRPSCGSVFRNPYPKTAGWLIEQIGLKGYQIGDAQVAHRHANFIINCGQAKAQDIFSLIRYVQEQVDRSWNLALIPEVKMLGQFS